jgi:hypothetical protein
MLVIRPPVGTKMADMGNGDEQNVSVYVLLGWVIVFSGVPRNFVPGRGFNKFS